MDDETTTKDDVLKLPLPEGMTRMECGPVQFGDDWPGYFLRGDRAFGLLQGRETVLSLMESGDTRYSTQLWATVSLAGIPDMKRCLVGQIAARTESNPFLAAEQLLLKFHQITDIDVTWHTQNVSTDGMVAVEQHMGVCTVKITAGGESSVFQTTNVVGALLMQLAVAQREACALVSPEDRNVVVPA